MFITDNIYNDPWCKNVYIHFSFNILQLELDFKQKNKQISFLFVNVGRVVTMPYIFEFQKIPVWV